MINNRITKLSHNQDSFNQASPLYAKAPKNSGYKVIMKYNKATSIESKNDKQRNKCINKRKRNVIWFNPPCNEEVQTNIGKAFLNLINKDFPAHHKLHKICNKFNIKLSYSCMPNMISIINNHNKNSCTPTPMTKIYYATAETFPTAHSMERPSKVHHLQGIHQCSQLTHPTLFWLLQN